jgi:hypothetical protein
MRHLIQQSLPNWNSEPGPGRLIQWAGTGRL